MQTSHSDQPRQDRLIALALGLLLLAIYLATSGFRLQSIDEVLTFTTTRSLLNRGTLDADTIYWAQPEGNHGGSVVTGIDGHAYVVKDLGASLLALPLVWIATLVKIVSPVRTALLLTPIITALTASLLYHLARQRGLSRAASLLTALTFGLASLAWPYAETLFTQPLAALGLLIALIGTLLAFEQNSPRYAILGGVGVGIASISAIPALVTLPLYFLYLIPWSALRDGSWRARVGGALRLVAAFGVGLVPFGLFHMITDQVRFGSPFITPYQASQVNNALQLSNLGAAGFGLLLSTPRGLIWYFPAVILIPFGLWLGWKTRRRELLLVGGQAALMICVYSTYAEWWGGNAWGPRLFLPIMPALVLLIAPLIDHLSKPSPWRARGLAALPIIASSTLQLLAGVFNTLVTERRFFDALIQVRASPTFLRDNPVLTDPRFLPWQRLLNTIRRGEWDTLWMSRPAPDWVLMAALAVLIGLGTAWLILALRGHDARRVRWGLAVQMAASLAVATFALVRYPTLPPGYYLEETPPLPDMDALIARLRSQANGDDAIIALIPYSTLGWLDRYDGAIHDTGFGYEQPLRALTERRLQAISRESARVWLATEKIDAGDRTNGVEEWLSQHAYSGTEQVFGDFRLIPYTMPSGDLQLQASGQAFGGGGIRLDGFAYERVMRPGGGWVNVWLRWKAEQHITQNATVFIHLLDSAGRLVAQQDGIPQAGYSPSVGWLAGALIDDRHSMALPASLPPGSYRLSVGLYDTTTGERVRLADGAADSLVVGSLEFR